MLLSLTRWAPDPRLLPPRYQVRHQGWRSPWHKVGLCWLAGLP